ncbi:hypothetical protein PoB_000540500 [Plakobranchus ocellatus]|uniref:Uncharacterized protein n=1 Tax=Plakobranchus ocellatus TaxID=259542 RepID=A0AAV3Y7Y0_9GAST|nr:hypothetical protein PoB_000540500 [Plakobranchus ocellatus]
MRGAFLHAWRLEAPLQNRTIMKPGESLWSSTKRKSTKVERTPKGEGGKAALWARTMMGLLASGHLFALGANEIIEKKEKNRWALCLPSHAPQSAGCREKGLPAQSEGVDKAR